MPDSVADALVAGWDGPLWSEGQLQQAWLSPGNQTESMEQAGVNMSVTCEGLETTACGRWVV